MIFYLSLWFPPALRARYAASYFIAIPMSNVIGGPLSGLLLQWDGWLGLHGWQWLFLVEALPALLLAVAVFFYLPDGPRDAKWLTDGERATIETDSRANTAEATSIFMASGWRSPTRGSFSSARSISSSS